MGVVEHDQATGTEMTNTQKHTANYGDERGLWRTLKSTGTVMGMALGAALLSAPAQADTGFEDAHALRSLDIMLMVTALRCRSGPNDFQNDYHNFSATHSQRLSAASRMLKRTFAAGQGASSPARALDRMGVKIANSYGDGHPWLDCAQLQQAARDLSQKPDQASLVQSARHLLSASRPEPQIAQSSDQGAQVRISYNMTGQWEQRP